TRETGKPTPLHATCSVAVRPSGRPSHPLSSTASLAANILFSSSAVMSILSPPKPALLPHHVAERHSLTASAARRLCATWTVFAPRAPARRIGVPPTPPIRHHDRARQYRAAPD